MLTEPFPPFTQIVNVPLAAARAFVPPSYEIVETKPGSGFTQGSIYVARYDNTSTVTYSELIFLCATVRVPTGQHGNWVASIYVDSEAAKDAGDDVWAMHKKMGTFEWDRATDPNVQHVRITDDATKDVIGEFSFNDKAAKIPWMHQTVQTFSQRPSDAPNAAGRPQVLLSSTSQKYGVKLLKQAIINIPTASPFYPFYKGATMGTKVEMAGLVANMTAPAELPFWSRAHGYFKTTPEVPAPEALKVQGALPTWLTGALIRNSPGGYEDGPDQVRHWNDGWAQLHRWEIDGASQTVAHRSRFLNTTSWWKAQPGPKPQTGRYSQVGYGTPKDPGTRPHAKWFPGACCDGSDNMEGHGLGAPEIDEATAVAAAARAAARAHGVAARKLDDTDREADAPTTEGGLGGLVGGLKDKYVINPMVNLWKFDNKFMATTDQNLFVGFDPVTLETTGGTNAGWDQGDPITKKGIMGIGVAHGRYDRWKKEHYWLEIDLNNPLSPAKYNVWTYAETGFNGTGPFPTPRKILATIEDNATSFIHSFALTDKYVLLIQCPMHYSFLKFLTAKQVIDTISWDPSVATKFHVVDRYSGELVKSVSDPAGAWFVYHVANAYDDPATGDIVVSFSKYQNDTLIAYGMYLENLVDDPTQYVPTYAQARFTECRLSTTDKSAGPVCRTVADKTYEMMTFNWQNYHMKKVRYTWGASFVDANTPWHAGTSDFIDEIVKLDITAGTVAASWHEDGVYVCEPLFAPHPQPKAEDDGALMLVGYDSKDDHSFLLVLDGATLQELARADMPGKLAANFHGKWCPVGEDFCVGL